MEDKSKICILSANGVFRKGLLQLLEGAPALSVKECECSYEVASEVINSFDPKVILVDVQLPSLIELECVKLLLESFPNCVMLALLPTADDFSIIELVSQGVKGVVTHQIGIRELVLAIKAVGQNDCYFSRPVLKKINDKYWHKNDATLINLTEDEKVILKEIASGSIMIETCASGIFTTEKYTAVRERLMEKTKCLSNAALSVYFLMINGIVTAE